MDDTIDSEVKQILDSTINGFNELNPIIRVTIYNDDG